jgi:hypothetical protein
MVPAPRTTSQAKTSPSPTASASNGTVCATVTLSAMAVSSRPISTPTALATEVERLLPPVTVTRSV